MRTCHSEERRGVVVDRDVHNGRRGHGRGGVHGMVEFGGNVYVSVERPHIHHHHGRDGEGRWRGGPGCRGGEWDPFGGYRVMTAVGASTSGGHPERHERRQGCCCPEEKIRDVGLIEESVNAYKRVLGEMVRGKHVPMSDMEEMYRKYLRVDVDANIPGYDVGDCGRMDGHEMAGGCGCGGSNHGKR